MMGVELVSCLVGELFSCLVGGLEFEAGRPKLEGSARSGFSANYPRYKR